MTTVYPSSDGYFQHDNAPCNKAQIISNWFVEQDSEFTILKLPLGCAGMGDSQHGCASGDNKLERNIKSICPFPFVCKSK